MIVYLPVCYRPMQEFLSRNEMNRKATKCFPPHGIIRPLPIDARDQENQNQTNAYSIVSIRNGEIGVRNGTRWGRIDDGLKQYWGWIIYFPQLEHEQLVPQLPVMEVSTWISAMMLDMMLSWILVVKTRGEDRTGQDRRERTLSAGSEG